MADCITCPNCKGKGTIKLTGIYADTLRGLRRLCARKGGYVVANVHARWFNCNATALSNRLAWLEDHGFAKSTKYGRQRRYTTAEGD